MGIAASGHDINDIYMNNQQNQGGEDGKEKGDKMSPVIHI